MLSVPYTDYKSLIVKYVLKLWQSQWDLQINNKLHEISQKIAQIIKRWVDPEEIKLF